MSSRLPIYSLLGSALLVLCCPSRATIYPVNDNDVPGLVSAITNSNSNGQDDTIELATNGTYVLTVRDNALNGLPAILPDGGHKLTIHGNGATIMRSTSGVPTFRLFYINSGSNVTLDRLILSNGNPGAFHGGAIYNDGETATVNLTITNCTISANSGDYGGAIFNDGYQDPSFPAHTANLTVISSVISNNTGTQYGGGIWNESGGINMNVSYCTFSQNSATARSAGAIQFDGSNGAAKGSIINSTFTKNSAANYGGAVNIDGASGSAILVITNCTFDQNTANWGGGVAMDGSSGTASVSVTNCTFNRDFSFTLGDAIYLSQTGSGTTLLSVGNTILASADPDFNLSIDNFSGGTATVSSQGHNLSDDAAGGDATTGPGGFLNQSGDIRNTNPLLDSGGLQNNGGPTLTIALQSGSPAIDQGGDALAPERDQRGYLRQAPTDIGAFEVNALLAPIVAGSNKASFAVNFPLTGKVGLECRTGGPSGNHQLAMSFATPITLTGVTVQSGVGTVSNFTASGSDLTVNLTGVANAQHVVVRLANVNDGVHTNNVDIPMDFLLGDTNADHFVDAIDAAQAKSKSGQTLDATNFREDVNNDGFLDAIDVALVKSKSGTSLPTANSNPGKGARRLSPGKSRDSGR